MFAIFLVLAGVAAFLSTKVNINHNIYSYMPANSETSQGLTIMEDEFDYGSTSTWKMMFEDLSDEQKPEVKTYIEGIDNVKSVAYDSSETYNREYNSHQYALYEITLNVPADSEEANKAFTTIDEHFSKDYKKYQTGEVFSNNGKVVSITITALAVGTAMVILTLMSESFIEPWLYLFAILIAVVLNKGTNIMFENVSHITDSISMVLQMALSMDYAIMLSSRYRQEKEAKDHPDKNVAMNRALRYSFGAISSSSITTVVGLIVLIFMSFTIGRDMGLVLSKGVVLSLVSIFTILPALLLLSDKAIEKTKKKTLTFHMKWIGDKEHKFRKIALPVFALVFVGAFFLKGNTNILFTDSQNNYIKDVFPVVNQTALVYENEDEKLIADLCEKYEGVEDVKRIVCYSNTIAEQEKYDEIIAKANELSEMKISGQGANEREKVEADDYLVKAIYYFYYRKDRHTMSLPEFARFVRDEILPSDKFSDSISSETRRNIYRLSVFAIPEEAEKARSRNEIAELLEVDASELDELYTLYLAKHPTGVRLTLNQFATFIENDILTNPKYSSMVSASQRADLEKLSTFTNPNLPGKATIEQLIRFALTDDVMKNELGVTDEEANKVLDILDNIEEIAEPYINEYPEIAEALEPIRKEYSYQEYINMAEQISRSIKNARDKLGEINEQYGLGLDFSKLDEINFDLAAKFERLKLAEYIVDNRETKYSAWDLAEAFGLNYEQLKLVYALYDYYYVTGDPMLSVRGVVDFLTDEVFTDANYAYRFDDAKKDKVRTVSSLMLSARMRTPYTYEGLYSVLASLSNNIDSNLIFLAYLYHGSLYDYDESWTLSLEEFANFLNDDILPDERFASRINDERRETIADAKVTIADAKALLVGDKHSRALIETELPAEGEKTFSFYDGIKSELGDHKNYLVGDSAMAYEMSKSFSGEMDFITLLTMAAIFVVVAFTFRSILIPLLLVLVIQSAVYIDMAYLSLTGQSIYFIALIIVQAILMGATIDYAILYTSYYLEQRKYAELGRKEAIISAYERSMHSIMTSASILILVTAIVGNLASAIAAKICQAISAGTLVATLIILFLLPALLATIDRFIVKKKL